MSLIIRRAVRDLLAGIIVDESRLDHFVWIKLIEEQLPLVVCLMALRRLLKENQVAAVASILNALESRGDAHPLLDEFIGKFMYCCGQYSEAVAFLKEANKRWRRDHLSELVGILEALNAKKEREDGG